MSQSYRPDFDAVCCRCGTSPCVVELRETPPNVINLFTSGNFAEIDTELCGPCYFSDAMMLDYWQWNEFDDTYLKTEEEDEDDDECV